MSMTNIQNLEPILPESSEPSWGNETKQLTNEKLVKCMNLNKN